MNSVLLLIRPQHGNIPPRGRERQSQKFKIRKRKRAQLHIPCASGREINDGKFGEKGKGGGAKSFFFAASLALLLFLDTRTRTEGFLWGCVYFATYDVTYCGCRQNEGQSRVPVKVGLAPDDVFCEVWGKVSLFSGFSISTLPLCAFCWLGWDFQPDVDRCKPLLTGIDQYICTL